MIATPAAAAQQVCDRLVASGVTSVLNFASTVLSVPANVDVRKVDLAVELQILSFHETRKSRAASNAPAEAPALGVDCLVAEAAQALTSTGSTRVVLSLRVLPAGRSREPARDRPQPSKRVSGAP